MRDPPFPCDLIKHCQTTVFSSGICQIGVAWTLKKKKTTSRGPDRQQRKKSDFYRTHNDAPLGHRAIRK